MYDYVCREFSVPGPGHCQSLGRVSAAHYAVNRVAARGCMDLWRIQVAEGVMQEAASPLYSPMPGAARLAVSGRDSTRGTNLRYTGRTPDASAAEMALIHRQNVIDLVLLPHTPQKQCLFLFPCLFPSFLLLVLGRVNSRMGE